VNGLDKSQEFDHGIVDKAGRLVASKTATVDAGKTLTLSYDPPAGVLVNARIAFSTDVSISSDVAVPSLEIVKVGTGPRWLCRRLQSHLRQAPLCPEPNSPD
jgi:hypothetical protein